MFKKIKGFVLSHKIVSIIIIVIIAVGVFFLIKNHSGKSVSYVTEPVTKGSITTTVTGTGQVEASSTVTLGTNASGVITYVGATVGQNVKKGQLLASVDSRDAKNALETSKLSLEDLTSVDSLDLLKSENSLSESYDSGWNKVSSYITDTKDLLTNLNDLYGGSGYLGYKNASNLSEVGRSKISDAENAYYKAQDSLNNLTNTYKGLSRSDSNEKIKSLINQAYKSAVLVSVATKDAEIAFNYVSNYLDDNSTNATTTKSDISSWLSTSNDYVNTLLSTYNGIIESEESLTDLKNGADESDVRSAKLNVESKQDDYNDCFVYAPFDGTIATMTAKVGEKTSSGVGTIITDKKVVTVSLNEVDIASVKLGQKATLTFDAIDGLTLNGEVSEIDSVGTVSSGVVTYNVKIVLDDDDSRVKAGMSTNVSIITASKSDILVVPTSAIKTKGNSSYVEVLNNDGTLGRKAVEVGISDDSSTEIISGLNEEDKIITKTVTGSSSSKSSGSSSTKSSSTKSSSSQMREMGGPAMGGMMR